MRCDVNATGYIRRTCYGFSLFTDENELVASNSYSKGTIGLESLARDLAMRLPITPYTAPDRFTAEEREMFLAGECGYQTAYGMPWTAYCRETSNPLADFGYCTEHEKDSNK